MGKLSKQEQALLEKLQAKAEAPDRPTPNLNVSLDLGDKEQVAYAKRMGWLDDDEDEDGDEDKDKQDEDADTPPKRRGYFDDAK